MCLHILFYSCSTLSSAFALPPPLLLLHLPFCTSSFSVSSSFPPSTLTPLIPLPPLFSTSVTSHDSFHSSSPTFSNISTSTSFLHLLHLLLLIHLLFLLLLLLPLFLPDFLSVSISSCSICSPFSSASTSFLSSPLLSPHFHLLFSVRKGFGDQSKNTVADRKR